MTDDYSLKAYLASLDNDALHELLAKLSLDAQKDLYDGYKTWAFGEDQ